MGTSSSPERRRASAVDCPSWVRPVTLLVVPGGPGAGPAAVGTGVLPLSLDDPGAKVTRGSLALVTADKGNDPPQNGRGLSQAWVRGPACPLAGPVST